MMTTINEVVLEQVRTHLRHTVSRYYMDAEVTSWIDPLTDHIEFAIRGSLLSEEEKEYTIKTPENWWEHLKHDKFPAWALKRWPVKYRQVTVSFRVLYPDYKPQLPEKYYGRHIVRTRIDDTTPFNWKFFDSSVCP
jgi:hypothetical protein